MAKFDMKKIGLFAGGVLFGTAGIKALSSKDAKKLYTNVTAAVLRVKQCAVNTATKVQENCGDIYAGAKQINKDRATAEECAVVEDVVEDTAEVAEEATETATEE